MEINVSANEFVSQQGDSFGKELALALSFQNAGCGQGLRPEVFETKVSDTEKFKQWPNIGEAAQAEAPDCQTGNIDLCYRLSIEHIHRASRHPPVSRPEWQAPES